MSYQRIVPAELAFAADGTPYSATYDDIYHAAAGGLEQAQHVFLAGNNLPSAWQGRERFVILETGFGLGLNFLATWQAWRADPNRCRRLHFVSVEQHPLRREDLARLHQRWPQLADLSAALVGDWPPAVPGLHRLHFDQGAVTLTLAFGDAHLLLPNMRVGADALYLDGFSPAKNPRLWSAKIAYTLAKLAVPGATLATWSVATSVRDNLSRAGFELSKTDGFAAKREMLVGHKPGTRPDIARPAGRRIVIVGAGAAGSSAAQRLAARGHALTVLEQAARPGEGASGNKAGVFRPLPTLDDSKLSRLLRAGFLYGRRHVASIDGVRCGMTGVLQLARDAQHEDIQRRVITAHDEPADLLRFVDRDEAAQLAGWPVASGGWWFATAGWINPPSLCAANLAGIDVRFGCTVERIEQGDDGSWRLIDGEGQIIAAAEVVILANGIDTPRMIAELPVLAARGLVSHLPEAAVPPFNIVATRHGYVTPAIDGIHCAGATHSDDNNTAARLEDHIENLQRLEGILPGYGGTLRPGQLAGRVGFRPMSPDRMPMVGRLAAEGLWTINGFGARGLVWASLCGELLASLIDDEPLPVENDLMIALDPGRFAAAPCGRGETTGAINERNHRND